MACGAPDFIVEQGGVPIGHVECKDLDANLDDVEESEQLQRYRDGLPNLILTDYLEFRWYANGTRRESARLGHLDGRGSDSTARERARSQTCSEPSSPPIYPSIGNPRDLARRMASKARPSVTA